MLMGTGGTAEAPPEAAADSVVPRDQAGSSEAAPVVPSAPAAQNRGSGLQLFSSADWFGPLN